MNSPRITLQVSANPGAGLPICELYELGSVPYQQAWELQSRLAEEIGTGQRPPTLLLLEHPHTFTFGRRGQSQNLLWSERDLEAADIAVHWVDRGGDVTYHGPGQLVGYPLLPLGKTDSLGRLPPVDYVGYLRNLEELLIRTLADFDLQTTRLDGLTGVWVAVDQGSTEFSKIAAIGVKVDVNGVSRHGFALNVDPDMSYWNGIIPCGINEHGVTSMADHLGGPVAPAELRASLATHFCEIFNCRLKPAAEGERILFASA